MSTASYPGSLYDRPTILRKASFPQPSLVCSCLPPAFKLVSLAKDFTSSSVSPVWCISY
jgi:hypothetical protein